MPIKDNAFGSHLVEEGGLVFFAWLVVLPENAEIAVAKIIGEYENDVGTCGL